MIVKGFGNVKGFRSYGANFLHDAAMLHDHDGWPTLRTTSPGAGRESWGGGRNHAFVKDEGLGFADWGDDGFS